MTTVGEYGAEAAFLNAMKDQTMENTLDKIIADSAKKSNEDSDTPDTHPDDVLKVNFDDDEQNTPVESTEIPRNDSPSGQTKSDGSDKTPPHNEESSTTTAPDAQPVSSSDSNPNVVGGEDASDDQTTIKTVELAGPFVIEQDDEPPVAIPASDAQNTTLTYQENHHVMDTDEKATASDATATKALNVPVLNVPGDSPTATNLTPSDSTSSSQTQQGKKKRLAHDIVGKLEDRIAQDSRGDLDAWLQLISEHQKKGKLDDARAVYERFLAMFPAAAEQWIAYIQMELDSNNLSHAERLFQRCLPGVLNVELWSTYLDYIRRRNNLVTDTTGKARGVITQVYEFVLGSIGIDKESGKIWQEYIAFIKSGPGTIGGSAWQDQQKMDHLRKTFQKVICIPVNGLEAMWKEYDQFEMGLNKTTGRKFISEKSPSYMTARSSLLSLRNTTNGLIRTTLPRLPPVPGFDGYEEYMQQIELWKKWIQWEKNDPLVLAQEPDPEDVAAYNNRIIYAYKQAVMALRFWPEMWFEAAEFCFSIGRDKEGVDILTHGMKANPESCLLHFRYAEYLESSVPAPPTEDKEAVKKRSTPIREVYDKILEVYYNLLNKAQDREKENVAMLEEAAKKAKTSNDDDDDDDYEPPSDTNITSQIAVVKDAAKQEILSISKIISAIWINLMRTMRRIEGHGKVGDLVGGSRQVFTDARKRGRITSDVYVASALMEFHCYKDPSANRIFDRGAKMFPEDEDFVLEYLKHLIATNDLTNARAVFETFVGKITPEKAGNAKRVYQFFYDYESQYGELSQIQKLEKRMRELYPQDPQLKLFQGRHSYKILNPSSFSPVVSPTQIRPKGSGSRPPASAPERSPKRQADDSDGDVTKNERPRKIARGESPIKGAAGRRLMDQQKRAAAAAAANRDQETRQTQSHHTKQASMSAQQPPPSSLPDSIMFLLSILPPGHAYRSARFSPDEIYRLLLNLNIPAPPPNQINGVSYFSSRPFYELLQTISASQHNLNNNDTAQMTLGTPLGQPFQPQVHPNGHPTQPNPLQHVPASSAPNGLPMTPMLHRTSTDGLPLDVTPPDSRTQEALRTLYGLLQPGPN
ncbi:mRNA 3'-end-processing protein rna14, variant 2 [Orbilia brochopaga]|uniref:mRNA 3'-end-processing protein RNA14 n=1 Tax=Orbilia brochopaga TaxID=3140254 RepID=A0AAV9UWI9_9PEZI